MNKKSVALIGVLAVAGAGYYWSTQNSASPEMVAADTTGQEAGAPLAQVELPETLSSQAMIGKRAFEAKCATCHGANAAGQSGVAPPLVHDIYRPGHHGEAAFLVAAKNGVRSHHWRFGNMPPVDGVTDAEVKSIVRYIRELQAANGIN